MTEKSNNKNTIIIVVAAIVLVAVIIAGIFLNRQLSWAETYEPDDKNPYGTQVLFELLKVSRSEQSFFKISDSTFKDLPEDPTSKTDTYIFIGNDLYADTTDIERVMKFVKAGNSAFIITTNPHHLVTDSLIKSSYTEPVIEEEDEYEYDDEEYENNDEDYEYDESEYIKSYIKKNISDILSDTSVVLSLKGFNNNKGYSRIARMYRNVKRLSYWSYFQDNLTTYNGDSISELGKIEGSHTNYIRFKYGKGYFYLHTTPLAFSNYYMINDTCMNYCRDALSYIGDGNVYWDEENRTYDYKAANHRSDSESPSKPQEGPLEFILSEPSLRTAWYLILAGTILYLMFGAKRKQRVISPMENMENTSIEYAEVISQMFMNQRDHKKLVKMKMDLFRSFLRDRFRIKFPAQENNEDQKLFDEIALKSDIAPDKIKDIFEHYNYLNTIVQVETSEMLSFHHKLENFYNNCK